MSVFVKKSTMDIHPHINMWDERHNKKGNVGDRKEKCSVIMLILCAV